MTILDIQNLITTNKIEISDFLHIIKQDGWKNILSYKSKANSLTSMFLPTSELDKLRQKIVSINNSFTNLTTTFATKESVDSTYVTKEKLSNTTPSLLKYETMESLTVNYVTENKEKRNAAECRKEANRLADEMTDFVGAAMVGINQSGASGVAGAAAAGEGEDTPGNNSGGS